MKIASHFFFYTYVGLVVLAGFWGAFISPHFDYRFLFGMDVSGLPDSQRINMLSQYRFLRALELGFGLFSLVFRRQIFTQSKFNTLFLGIMACGIVARLLSILIDGRPNSMMLFFMIYEFIGILIIYLYTSHQKQMRLMS